MPQAAQPSRDADRSSAGGAAAAASTKLCPTCNTRYPDDYAVCPRDATPLAREGKAGDPLLGQILGDTYEVTRMIGEGGMGRVYEARHVRLGRRFALKVLHTQFANDPESVARFRREATAAAAVASPHVAQVVDAHATRDGRPYLVSELLTGEELGTVLKREGSLEVGRAVAIARQVARGLAAAHAAGVVHRDLKPENVYLVRGPDGREFAKVLDFGIAKSITGDGSLTRTGMVLGTPAYMAPEQARSSSGLDHRVDVYALGAVLYRALTGRLAFTGDDPGTTLTSVLYDEPERPKALRRDLPDGLELVIQRAMAKAVTGRYGSMAEIDAALAPFDTGAADSAALVALPAPAVEVAGAATVAAAALGSDASGERARRARPRAVGYGALAVAWCWLALAVLTAAVIRAVSGRAVLDSTGSVLAAVVGAAVTVPLAVLAVRDLVRGAWRNTAAMLRRADVLRDALGLSFAMYALVAGAWHGGWTVFAHAGAAPATAEGVACAAALVAGVATGWWKTRAR
jgi:serine/threonine-protein kinase